MKLPASYSVVERPTLFSVQYVRGIAAMMVAYHHTCDRLPGVFELLGNPVGEAGVDLFFVISGFIMVVITARQDVQPGAFMLRRITRIAPAYWFYTSLLALIILVMPGAVHLEMTLAHYLNSIFFIPHFNPTANSIMPLLQPGWTLNFEMFFYCLFAVSLFAPAPHRIVVLVTALVVLFAIGQAIEPAEPALAIYTSPLLLEFGGGVVIGYLYISGVLAITRGLGWLLIVTGSAIAITSATYVLPRPFEDFFVSEMRVATYGVAAVLVVVGALALERAAGRRNRANPLLTFLGLIGDASYSVYLSHLFSIDALRVAWLRLGLGTEGLWWALAFVAAGLFAAVTFGILSYLVLERPVTRGLNRMLRHRPAASAV
jgi:exopolysaccharide production protein ExoZ